MQRILIILMALTLAACGGGGDAGDLASEASPTGLTVTFSNSALNFTNIEGQFPAAQIIKSNVTGNTSATVVIGAEVTGTAVINPIIAVTDAGRTGGILIAPVRSLAPGTYTGTIILSACTTSSCTQHHAGSPQKVSYVVTVLPAL
jgi:hypothetical protein